MIDILVISFFAWIIFGCIALIGSCLCDILIDGESINKKLDQKEINSVPSVILLGFITFGIFIFYLIDEYIYYRKRLKEIREKSPWWSLKEHGGWL